MKTNLYTKMYTYNSALNQYLIELDLERFSNLFDEWDGSTIRKKDLDPDMVDYLVEAARELPKNANFKLVFHLREKKNDTQLESLATNRFDDYFSYQIFLNEKKISRLVRQALFYLMFGLILITGSYIISALYSNLTINVLIEGLFIGGWVFVWESISLLFFKRRQITSYNKHYKKIISSPKEYQYHKQT